MFPGIGADARLLEPQRAAGIEIEVPSWIAPLHRETLPEYAARIATTIRTPRPYWIGGVSFGGAIALEVARHVQPTGVLLIASCRSCREITRFHAIARSLARFTPASAQKWMNLHTPATLRAVGACTPRDRELILAMIRDTPASFLKWALQEILRWAGPGELSIPIHRIHGERDRTIPCPRNADNCVVVLDAGHLINVTHASDVNEFIRREFDRR